MRARWLLVAAAVCAGVAGFWLARQIDRGSPQLASGTWLPRPRPVAGFVLHDTAGRPFTRADLATAPSLVFFGFTHCPDVCPTTLAMLAGVVRRAAVPGLRVLFVSVDPARDGPQALEAYVHAFSPDFRGFSGDAGTLAQLGRDFGVAVIRVPLPGGDYTMDHTAAVFLVDRGDIVAVFTPPFDAAAIAADLRRAARWLAAPQPAARAADPGGTTREAGSAP